MGTCFLYGNGGGGGTDLNFEIVGGTAQPTNPTENTIWVNTDAAVTGWIISASEPENPTDGMVWVIPDARSKIVFNAMRKNAILITPLSAKQYISGAWVDVEAQIYQDGAWMSFDNGSLWIVRNGVLNPGIDAAGVGKGPDSSYTLLSAVTITDGSGSCMVTTTDGCGMVYFGPISLTDVNAITIDGAFNFAGYDAYYQFCAWTEIGAYTTSYRAANVKMTATGATLDVSGITGDHYIGFTTRGAATQSVANLYVDGAL